MAHRVVLEVNDISRIVNVSLEVPYLGEAGTTVLE
jgi:hypothetical protein